jgi:hypothetical protein
MVADFEAALAIEAFAQHYLQDSFASGHMGFNRVASSNASALVYHDHWSQRGRCVANQKNEAWYTYGDGYLAGSSDTQVHVISAAANSLFDFLRAFIDGRVDAMQWQVIWAEFPSTFKDSISSPSSCTPGQGWPSLRSVSLPAETAQTYEISTVTDSSIYRPTARGLMFVASRELGLPIPIGYRTLQTRIFGGIGLTTHQLGGHALLVDFGEVVHVGSSFHGSVTHELGFGEMFYYMQASRHYKSYRNNSVRLLYAGNVEIGKVFVRLQTGFARGYGTWGPHIALSVGVVRKSAI